MRMFFTGNCGLMFITKDVIVFVDGLVGDDNRFTEQDYNAKEKIKTYFSSFGGSRVMLFTHCHSDHFDKEQAWSYIVNGDADRIIMPHNNANNAGHIGFAKDIAGIKTISEDDYSLRIKNVAVKFIKAQHLYYPGYSDVHCYCIEIEYMRKRYLVLGDADPIDLQRILDNTTGKADYIFVNPVILGKRKWIEVIYEWNPNANFLVYHIPDSKLDQYGYRKLAESKAKEYQEIIPNLKILFEKMEFIY